MRRAACAVIAFSICVAAGATGVAGENAPRSGPVLRIGEGVLRALATNAVRPEYPLVSKQQGVTGVSVVELIINPDGSVRDVRVLQAPDDPTAKSVALAVRHWRFKPLRIRGQAQTIVGKLTFYFRQRGGVFTVEDPRAVRVGRGLAER